MGEGEREGGRQGGEMAQTMYAHVNKWIKFFKVLIKIRIKFKKRMWGCKFACLIQKIKLKQNIESLKIFCYGS
jgi:hypothetical protein